MQVVFMVELDNCGLRKRYFLFQTILSGLRHDTSPGTYFLASGPRNRPARPGLTLSGIECKAEHFCANAAMKFIFTSLLLSANLFLTHAEEIVAPSLPGYNVAAPIISRYDTFKYESVDFGHFLSIHKLLRKRSNPFWL